MDSLLQELAIELSRSYDLAALNGETKLRGDALGSQVPEGQQTATAGVLHESDAILLAARVNSIAFAVYHTVKENEPQVKEAVKLIATWMKERKPVRMLGAGRALLAAGMPGNRLAHAGAHVSYMGGMVPLPNSILGGGIIACSASGETAPVLEAMAKAKKNNKEIKTIGIADFQAKEFAALCDVFIGLRYPQDILRNPLSALADTKEYMISEILDGLVVLAGTSIGLRDDDWRKGHEDIGPTGPYAPRGPASPAV